MEAALVDKDALAGAVDVVELRPGRPRCRSGAFRSPRASVTDARTRRAGRGPGVYAPADEPFVRWLPPAGARWALRRASARSISRRSPSRSSSGRSTRACTLVVTPAFLADRLPGSRSGLAAGAALAGGEVIPLVLEECALPLHVQAQVRLDLRRAADWDRELRRLRDQPGAAGAHPRGAARARTPCGRSRPATPRTSTGARWKRSISGARAPRRRAPRALRHRPVRDRQVVAHSRWARCGASRAAW